MSGVALFADEPQTPLESCGGLVRAPGETRTYWPSCSSSLSSSGSVSKGASRSASASSAWCSCSGAIGTRRGSRTTTGSVLDPVPVSVRDGGRGMPSPVQGLVQLPDRIDEDLSRSEEEFGQRTCEVRE